MEELTKTYEEQCKQYPGKKGAWTGHGFLNFQNCFE